MKFSLSWLKDHLETDADAATVAETLTRIGLEVEGIENPAEALKPFTVARVLTAERHPQADKLQVLTVDTGKGDALQVVCGAPNARAGLVGVFGGPGTYIPGSDFTDNRTLRSSPQDIWDVYKETFDYLRDLLPALLVFSLGLAMTVAPLTATVLADADESNAGIASGVNNAIARIAGLLAVAAIGAVVAAQFNASLDESLAGQTLPAPARSAVEQARKETLATVDPAVTGTEVAEDVESASSEAFHVGIGISTVLVALGGLLGLAGIRNPRRVVRCQDCAGGQLAGQPLDLARERRTLSEPAGSGA